MENYERKSSKEHWDDMYEAPRMAINPNWKPIYYDFRSIGSVIQRAMMENHVGSIFEIGCGDSVWLPYLMKKYSVRGGIRLFGVRVR